MRAHSHPSHGVIAAGPSPRAAGPLGAGPAQRRGGRTKSPFGRPTTWPASGFTIISWAAA